MVQLAQVQQAFLVDLVAAVGNAHAAPVGLASDQAVALEQVGVNTSVTSGWLVSARSNSGAGV